MQLVNLKEGHDYGVEDLCQRCFGEKAPKDAESFFGRLAEVMNRSAKMVSRSDGKFSFEFVGLFDFTDKDTSENLTFFFWPKFVSDGTIKRFATADGVRKRDEARNAILLAIDRCHKEMALAEVSDERPRAEKESLLELVVRLLRDYLENGVYMVRPLELEHNGRGEINWDETIERYQPIFLKGTSDTPRPCYMDTATEISLPDENHYLTRLHQCLVTIWGRKLEELGLSSVLRVNVPLLSEDELDFFGETDWQIDRINKELGVQFVTKSRHTLQLMKELIARMSNSETELCNQLSFGMNKAEHLWEFACAAVLGSELDEKISDCGLDWPQDITFRDYMPRPIWRKSGSDKGIEGDEENAPNDSIKSGWRLDFIRTYPPNRRTNDPVTKLVILDAKYYDVRWIGNPIAGQAGIGTAKPSDDKIIGQPGIGDIAKQIFYQMAFQNLAAENKKADGTPLAFVNAFLFPEDDKKLKNEEGNFQIKASERVHLGWGKQLDRDEMCASAFKSVNLFAVRLPGIELLRRYANGKSGDDWFKEIVQSQPTPHKDPSP